MAFATRAAFVSSFPILHPPSSPLPLSLFLSSSLCPLSLSPAVAVILTSSHSCAPPQKNASALARTQARSVSYGRVSGSRACHGEG